MSLPRRKTWLWLILAVVVSAGTIAAFRAHRVALLGSGFMAQTLCAGVFVSGREPQRLMSEELGNPAYELLHYFRAEIDREGKRVTASLHGLAAQTAIFREGLGCTLLHGESEAELRAQGAGLFGAPEPAGDGLWPDGERVNPGSLSAGVNRGEVETAIEALFSEPDPAHRRGTRALVVVHEGRIVAERYAEGFDASMPLPGWSMTKTATNILIGMRVKDGALALEDAALMPEWRGNDDPRRAITLDDLMRMSSGLAFNEDYGDDLGDVTQMLYVQPDAARFAASKSLEHRPGTLWAYSSGTTNIISGVLRETFADERDYLRYPGERLFGALGMRSAVLQPDVSGTFVGSSFLYASARDWARLGLFLLREGKWRGEQLVPEHWLDYTLKPTTPSPHEEYGAQVWLKLPESPGYGEPPMPDDAYYLLGYDGQVTAVIPSRDLVIVRLGLTPDGGDWDNARKLAPLVSAFPAQKP
ncbi:MAG: serine hydrolase domain-containing protein [Methyloceanibacter sp.]